MDRFPQSPLPALPSSTHQLCNITLGKSSRRNRWRLVVGMACLVLNLAAQAPAQMGGGGMGAMGSTGHNETLFEGSVKLPWALAEGNTHLNAGSYYVTIKPLGPDMFLLISKDKRSTPLLRVMGRNVKPAEADRMVKKNSMVVELKDAGTSPDQKAAVFVLRHPAGAMDKGNVERWEFKLNAAPDVVNARSR